jgi:hypothetical protein
MDISSLHSIVIGMRKEVRNTAAAHDRPCADRKVKIGTLCSFNADHMFILSLLLRRISFDNEAD